MAEKQALLDELEEIRNRAKAISEGEGIMLYDKAAKSQVVNDSNKNGSLKIPIYGAKDDEQKITQTRMF
jgi:hypothetical protein